MKVLLDTNILISRENPSSPQFATGKLLFAIDKFGYEKMVHPASIEELNKYSDEKQKEILFSKLESYHIIKVRPQLSDEFMEKLSSFDDSNKNSIIDNELLFQIYDDRVDFLITEDKTIYKKADKLNLSNKVFSIERFLQYYNHSFPDLIDYKMLSIKKTRFGEHDINNPFFDSFKKDYNGFQKWFKRKSEEEIYTFEDENGLSGLLYIKEENQTENYSHIYPYFSPAKRLKIGTFKVIQSGFRIGERFLKIIFDNAIERNVDEIYVTLFESRQELVKLKEMFLKWGFYEYGKNVNTNEIVLVKKMNYYDPDKSPTENFPNFKMTAKKRFLPIYPIYHTSLFPDSILHREKVEDYDNKKAYEYALQKVYVSWASFKDSKPGDIVLIYRTGGSYKGVVSTVTIIDELVRPTSKEHFFKLCQNRTIFNNEQLEEFWHKHGTKNLVVKLLHLKSLKNRVIINELWKEKIVTPGEGPRPFDLISEEDFNKILEMSKTSI